MSGLADVGAGGAGIATLATTAAAPVAAGLSAFKTGLKLGNYGDHQVKDLGWFHDRDGNPESVSEWAGGCGRSTREWFAERGHPYIGSAAGAAATAGTAVAGVPVAIAGAVVGTDHKIGDALAHHHRVNHFMNYDGMNVSHQAAEGLADYDDEQRAAAERAKREHPERWGNNPNNPSKPQAFAHLMELAQGKGGVR